MRKLITLMMVVGLAGCGDFVDEDGNTSIRQVAEGLQSLGDRLGEMGEALERDADVRAVPWRDLLEAIPDEVENSARYDVEGDDATDRNGAGMSIAHATYVVDADTLFVGVADLGALRGGVHLALRWVAPLLARGEIDGDIEEIRVEGHDAVRIRDEHDDGLLIAMIVDDRFAVVGGSNGSVREQEVLRALDRVDFDRLEDWRGYGR